MQYRRARNAPHTVLCTLFNARKELLAFNAACWLRVASLHDHPRRQPKRFMPTPQVLSYVLTLFIVLTDAARPPAGGGKKSEEVVEVNATTDVLDEHMNNHMGDPQCVAGVTITPFHDESAPQPPHANRTLLPRTNGSKHANEPRLLAETPHI